jgi:hypothetical protein
MQNMNNVRNMNLKLRFTYEPEEDDLSRDEIADRLGDEMVEMLEDLMLCP